VLLLLELQAAVLDQETAGLWEALQQRRQQRQQRQQGLTNPTGALMLGWGWEGDTSAQTASVAVPAQLLLPLLLPLRLLLRLLGLRQEKGQYYLAGVHIWLLLLQLRQLLLLQWTALHRVLPRLLLLAEPLVAD
jgi:hypothetical protein